MTRPLYPKFALFDDFLPESEATALLDFAIARRTVFAPTGIMLNAKNRTDQAWRRSSEYQLALESLTTAFETAIRSRFEEFCAAAGTPPFALHALDLTLSAHCDGDYYRRHFDTMTAAERAGTAGDRVVSCVYYLHREPCGFSGGELLVYPLVGDGEPLAIAPRHNRLAVFPSIAPHEVAQTHVPGNAWEDARFSLNCWLLRER